jgi:hypothetical protein
LLRKLQFSGERNVGFYAHLLDVEESSWDVILKAQVSVISVGTWPMEYKKLHTFP